MSPEGAALIRRTSKTDNYSTPVPAAGALFSAEDFHGLIWEPAAGEGNIYRAWKERDLEGMVTSDIREGIMPEDLLNDGHLHHHCHDFLEPHSPFSGVSHVVTNPPFRMALDFALRALQVTRERQGKVALLLRIQFLEGETRKEFLGRSPLKRVLVFSKRVSMYPEGSPPEKRSSGTQLFAWFVWDWTYRKGPPQIGWL